MEKQCSEMQKCIPGFQGKFGLLSLRKTPASTLISPQIGLAFKAASFNFQFISTG